VTAPSRVAGASENSGVNAASPLPELIRLGGTTPLRDYIRNLWNRREFALVIPLGELKAQNMNTVLGNLWHLLNPIMLVGIYYLIFGVILRTSRGVDNFVTFLTIGVFTFQFTQRCMIGGANTIVSNAGLIRSIQFPRALLVISTVVNRTLAFLPMLGIIVVLALATGERPGLDWLLLAPIYLAQVLFNLGGAFVFARAADRFRDLQNVLPHAFRILFYLSGVMFSVDRFVEDPMHRFLFELIPTFAFVSLARAPILGLPVDWVTVVSASVWTVVLLSAGFVFFKAGERSYGRG
jgi:teichoic acid transport system permease protein